KQRVKIAPGGELLKGDDAKPIVKTPATKPTAPKPQAKVTDEVQTALNQIAEAYGKLQSLELAATISLKVEGENTKGSHESSYTSTYRAPSQFRMQGDGDELMLGSTGPKVFGYSPYSNVYLQVDAKGDGKEKLLLSALPADHQKILPRHNLSLLL